MHINQIYVFLSIVIAFLLLLDFYTIKKFLILIAKRNWNQNFKIATLLLALSMFILTLILIIGRSTDLITKSLSIIILSIISFWYLPKILIVPFIIIFDLSKKIFNLFNFIKRKFFKLDSQIVTPKKLKPSNGRRKFTQNMALSFAALPFLLAFKGLVFTAYDLKIFRIKVPLVKLPLALEGLKIVQISDLHLGGFYSMNFIQKMRELINNLQPDLIFITGDFVNFNPNELDDGLIELNKLSSKYGIYGCLGNHDHYMTDSDHKILIAKLNESNIKLMVDSNLVLEINGEYLNIASTDYIGNRQKFGNIEKALAGLSPANTTILMLHDPISWEDTIVYKTFVDLTLSGHTHGGQIAFELLGAKFSFAQFLYKQFAGLYSKNDQYLYVNRGIGTSGPPMRLSMNPEITLLTLTIPDNLG